MCERYVVPDQQLVERELLPDRRWWKFTASFNVAPARNVPAVRVHDGESEGVMMRWGLIPAWAKGDPSAGNWPSVPLRDVASSTACRASWLSGQRCILPCAGFYAWRRTRAGYRQPYFLQLDGQPVFAVAGLWDGSVTESDDVIESCTIITLPVSAAPADAPTARDYDMPAILGRESYGAWLNATPVQAQSLLKVFPAERMCSHPVSPRVNSLRYDDPLLVRPVAAMTG